MNLVCAYHTVVYPIQHVCFCCLSGTTCIFVVFQNITILLLLLCTRYLVYYSCIIAVCVEVLWSWSLYLGWIVSVDAECAGNRRKLIFTKYLHQVSCLLNGSWKTSAVSTTGRMVETQHPSSCIVHQTRSLDMLILCFIYNTCTKYVFRELNLRCDH